MITCEPPRIVVGSEEKVVEALQIGSSLSACHYCIFVEWLA